MRGLLRGFLEDQSGATAIEYALLSSLLFVGCIVALETMSGSLVAGYNMVAGYLQSAAGG